MTVALQIADAIAWHVLQLNLTPRTTLSAIAHAGDRVLHVTPLLNTQSRPRMGELATLTWYDNTSGPGYVGAYDTSGEPRYAIASVSNDGTQITLDTATGLAFDHPSGTIVSANCYARRPLNVAAGLNSGDPVIYLGAARKRTILSGAPQRKAQPVYTVELRYHRQLFRSAGVDPNIWVMEQEEVTLSHLEQIENRLLTNQGLRTATTTAVAKRLGVENSTSADITSWAIDRFEVEQDTWEFAAVMQIVVSAQFVDIAN
jgi:hypothetical protein